jgi:hypothetical protein
MVENLSSKEARPETTNKRAWVVAIALVLAMACVVSASVTRNESGPTALVYIDAMGERQHIMDSQDSKHGVAAAKSSGPSRQQILAKAAVRSESSVDAPILDALREHKEMEKVSEHLLHLKQGMDAPPKVHVWHDKKVHSRALLYPISWPCLHGLGSIETSFFVFSQWDKDYLHAMPADDGTKLGERSTSPP